MSFDFRALLSSRSLINQGRLIPSVYAAIGLAGGLSADLLQRPTHAQSAPVAESRAAANAAGTTVNNQSNAQINTNTFYGFGPGINCPTQTISVSGFGGGGSGSSAGATIGADVNSGNYGGILTWTVPLGGANAAICKEIGKAQVEALRSQVLRTSTEAAKTQADINLVTAIKCVEILRVAELSGPFAEVCRGVIPRGMVATLPSRTSLPRPAAVQRFNP